MAVISNYGNTTTSTINGFVRAEAYNIGMFSSTYLALTTTRTIPVTFANAGTLQKVMLGLILASHQYLVNVKSVTVALQDAGVTKASVTLTSAQIAVTEYNPAVFATPSSKCYEAVFSGFSYPVTTAVGRWTLVISQGAQPTGWSLRTSDGANPHYIAFCDNKVSFASGADCLIVDSMAGDVSIDADCYLKGILGTGDVSGRSVCGIVTSGTSVSPSTVCAFLNDNSTARVLTLNGFFVIPAHGGVQFGTAVAPVPIANPLTINIIPATVGNPTYTGFCNPDDGFPGTTPSKMSAVFFGEYPAIEDTSLLYDAAVGAAVTFNVPASYVIKNAHYMVAGTPMYLTTTGVLPDGITAGVTYYTGWQDVNTWFLYDTYDNSIAGGLSGRVILGGTQSGVHTIHSVIVTQIETGWDVGDTIGVGGLVNKDGGDIYVYTIASIAGKEIRITPDLFTDSRHFTRKAIAGSVIRLNGYGITINNTAAIGGFGYSTFMGACNCWLQGCQLINVAIAMQGNSGQLGWGIGEPIANTTTHGAAHCGVYCTAGSKSLYGPTIFAMGFTLDHCNFVNAGPFSGASTMLTAIGQGGPVNLTNCRMLTGMALTTSPGLYFNISGNSIENFAINYGQGFITFLGGGFTFNNNRIWGAGSAYIANTAGGGPCGTISFAQAVNPLSVSGNWWNNNGGAVTVEYFCAGMNISDNLFGNLMPNTYDFVWSLPNTYCKIDINNPVGNLNFNTYNQQSGLAGSSVRVVGWNATVGDNRSWYPYGTFTSAGQSIVQTSNNGVNVLEDKYNVQTTLVSGQSFCISIGCEINDPGYYAGVNTLPTLETYYDATSVSSVAAASTAHQVLSTVFTPATNYADIVVDLQTLTDAIAANAGVTWDTLTINCRKYGYAYTSQTPTIQQTLDTYVGSFGALIANPFVTLTNAAAGALTGITYDGSTITQTVDHSVSEVYQYFQWWGTQTANMGSAIPFDTNDGNNFTCAAHFVLDNCTISGNGSQKIIQLGGHTYTNLDGRTEGVIFVDAFGTHVAIALAGIVPGSTVQIYNTSTLTELYNAVVYSDTASVESVWLSNQPVRVRVRKVGYLPYEYSGVVTNVGLAITVTQSVDSIYNANGIDGNIVTEFSLNGSTVEIFISDPDNVTTGQRLYNWYMYAISTMAYIGLQPYDITAQTAWSYVLADVIQLKNTTAFPLFISGANLNNVSGNGQVIDPTGGTVIVNGYFPFSSTADVANALWAVPFPDLATLPDNPTAEQVLQYLYMDARNKKIASASQVTLTDKNGNPFATQNVTDDGVTVTRNKADKT